MFQEYDVVVLKTNIPEISVPVATRGTVLIVYSSPLKAYEVEFFDKAGDSLGTFTIEEVNLDLVEKGDKFRDKP